MDVRAGQRVSVVDAFGTWHPATADSEIEPGSKFPIIWVHLDEWPDERMPWPVESVNVGTAR